PGLLLPEKPTVGPRLVRVAGEEQPLRHPESGVVGREGVRARVERPGLDHAAPSPREVGPAPGTRRGRVVASRQTSPTTTITAPSGWPPDPGTRARRAWSSGTSRR